MATISFKSVGQTAKKRIETAVTGSLLPIGLITPLRYGKNSEGIFAMHTDVSKQIADNLRNLILTNHGERLVRYDYGANLQPLLFEVVSSQPDFDDEATVRIKNAVSKFMPFVQLDTFESNIINHDNLHTGKVQIRITYNVPELDIFDDEIQVTLFIV